MATRIYLRGTTTHPRAKRAIPGTLEYRDMTTTQGASKLTLSTVSTSGAKQRQFGITTALLAFWSERVATAVTLSGTINFHLWAASGPLGQNLRARVSKITAGGGDVETDLGWADATANMTVNPTYGVNDFSVTLPADVAIAPNERFLLRVYIFRPDGADVTTAQLSFSAATGVDGDSWVELPQTVTFKPNTTVLSLRRTTATGIGAFMDLLPTFDTIAFASAVVNSVPSGTEVVWTKTAGGITAEWLSPRFKSQWDLPPSGGLDGKAMMGCTIAAKESALTVNGQTRLRAFIRRSDGTETLIWYSDPMNGIELTTTMANSVATAGNFYAQTVAGEDDRLVVRCYLVNVGTMGSGTATLGYDGPISTTGTSQVTGNDMPDFKAESDPPKGFVVPSGGATLGLSNGQ